MMTQEKLVSALAEPAGACHVAFISLTGSRWLPDRIDMQDDFRHLSPVRALSVRIQQPQIGDRMRVIVGRQCVICRREIVAIGIERHVFPGISWPAMAKLAREFDQAVTVRQAVTMR